MSKKEIACLSWDGGVKEKIKKVREKLLKTFLSWMCYIFHGQPKMANVPYFLWTERVSNTLSPRGLVWLLINRINCPFSHFFFFLVWLESLDCFRGVKIDNGYRELHVCT